MLTFNKDEAVRADAMSSQINTSGKYVGVITRAEKLISKSGSQGLGISFKSDTGETADYLDLWILNAQGEQLISMKHAQAIMGCAGVRQAKDGKIEIEVYNKESKKREKKLVDGYPDLMGKRIGLLLQAELDNYGGKDRTKMQIYNVFQDKTELTISEILDKKTKPELLAKFEERLAAIPVKDVRKNLNKNSSQQQPSGFSVQQSNATEDDDTDLPF